MTGPLRELWTSAPPWQRRTAIAIAVVASLLLYVWAVWWAERACSRLEATLAQLREQAVQLERNAAEYERLRKLPRVSSSSADLRTLLRSTADASGLARALVRIEAQDAHRVQLMFSAVAFADWLAWIERLQPHQVRVETCRIEALAMPGLVNASATLVRAGGS